MKYPIIFIFVIVTILSSISHCYSEDNKSKALCPIVSSEQKKTLTPFPDKEWMHKIVKRHEFEEEGWALVDRGLLNEAILKFRAATDPSLLNNEGDKVFALWAISDIYRYQGKLNEALELHEKYILPLNPSKDEYIEKRLELIALIRARETKSNKPIYDYINYLKTKYEKYLPPKGYATPYSSKIEDLIHLYDYMHDYDSGVAFIDEIIKYHTNHPNKSHRSAHAKDVAEYARVKQAWELDKKTGKHGHLQDVIKTSDFISW